MILKYIRTICIQWSKKIDFFPFVRSFVAHYSLSNVLCVQNVCSRFDVQIIFQMKEKNY